MTVYVCWSAGPQCDLNLVCESLDEIDQRLDDLFATTPVSDVRHRFLGTNRCSLDDYDVAELYHEGEHELLSAILDAAELTDPSLRRRILRVVVDAAKKQAQLRVAEIAAAKKRR